MAEERSELDRALAHPVRAELVRQLWHRGEPASAGDLAPAVPDVTLGTVSYHLRTLDKAGVIQGHGDAEEAARRSYVVAGPNSGEAVRRLWLT
jgi:DNA-binding transcriptional ArsR family regulator